MRTAIFQTFINPTRKAICVIIAIKALTPFADNLNSKMKEVLKHLRNSSQYENLMRNTEVKHVIAQLKLSQ